MKLIEKTIGVRPDGDTIVQYVLDLSEKKKPGRKKANIDPDVLAAYVIGGFSYSEIGRKLKKSGCQHFSGQKVKRHSERTGGDDVSAGVLL